MSQTSDDDRSSSKSVIYSVTRNALTQKEFDETFKNSTKEVITFRGKAKNFMCKVFNKKCLSTECLMNWIPIVRWMKEYKITGLSNDVTAGITVAIMNVPQSMAYAQLANYHQSSVFIHNFSQH